ncbi:MAG TPA: CpsD/CapB family tyrosine-protein kinase, partial [Actinomycetota bacterium]|nr:CpsD/CapB family tyrosine-protein kinase [Actinomycetota bacterium]
LAFLRERLDDRLRGRDDLEVAAEAPVLASIPRVPSWKRKESAVLVTFAEPKSAAAEAYRTLRTSVLFAMGQSNAKVLMVTSPHAGDGKTTTAANLATVLGQAGKRVVLVSADLRKPRVHQFFGLETKTGLTNVLAGEVSPWQAVRPTHIENLQVLAAGPIPGNPAELLGSDAMGNLLSALAETSDIVIVDAAPVLAVSDALAMVTLTDGVLLVADAEETHRGAVQHARRQLHQVDARIIGAVFNNFDPERAAAYSYYGGYGYYGSPRYEQPATSASNEVVSERGGFFRRSG